MELAIGMPQIAVIGVAILACLLLFKIIKSAIKWAIIAAIVVGAIMYFHII